MDESQNSNICTCWWPDILPKDTLPKDFFLLVPAVVCLYQSRNEICLSRCVFIGMMAFSKMSFGKIAGTALVPTNQ